ncbi:MAG: tRNA (uridine(34)/cytosine(34)/5-carboxymethylaminomethyluridine(34)-2'-O)-methyltransferase TrmL [Gammaproteobacteria bacterium]|jgi:tRNA (cytidine/uridine-2'-O-)-methyltransferase|nr:tRNA (uridine(34)/cytosine(34)/5-carboxymethylaminomethyluridine(34)-2'-O)-methyltransferase TrmL [Gammaproteobacteria bacterium]
MFHVVLFEPEIPPNTGNIIRLCANMGCDLHLIHPLGFSLDDKKLRRAGLDYQEWTTVTEHQNYSAMLKSLAPRRIFACSTKGRTNYDTPNYQAGDTFVFGPETRGLPATVLEKYEPNYVVRIPMRKSSRSINIANSVGIILYEAWRQNAFHR